MASSNVPHLGGIHLYNERSWSTEALNQWDPSQDDESQPSTSTPLGTQAQVPTVPVTPIYHPSPYPPSFPIVHPPSAAPPTPPAPPAHAAAAVQDQKLNRVQRLVQWVQTRGRIGKTAEKGRASEDATDRLAAIRRAIRRELEVENFIRPVPDSDSELELTTVSQAPQFPQALVAPPKERSRKGRKKYDHDQRPVIFLAPSSENDSDSPIATRLPPDSQSSAVVAPAKKRRSKRSPIKGPEQAPVVMIPPSSDSDSESPPLPVAILPPSPISQTPAIASPTKKRSPKQRPKDAQEQGPVIILPPPSDRDWDRSTVPPPHSRSSHQGNNPKERVKDGGRKSIELGGAQVVPTAEKGFLGQEVTSVPKAHRVAKDKGVTTTLNAELGSTPTPEQGPFSSRGSKSFVAGKGASPVTPKDSVRTSSNAMLAMESEVPRASSVRPLAVLPQRNKPSPHPQALQQPPSSMSNPRKSLTAMQKHAAKYEESPPEPFIPSPPALSQHNLSPSGRSSLSLTFGHNVDRSPPTSLQWIARSPPLSMMPSPPGMASPEGGVWYRGYEESLLGSVTSGGSRSTVKQLKRRH